MHSNAEVSNSVAGRVAQLFEDQMKRSKRERLSPHQLKMFMVRSRVLSPQGVSAKMCAKKEDSEEEKMIQEGGAAATRLTTVHHP